MCLVMDWIVSPGELCSSLNSGTYEWDLTWKWGLCRCSQVKGTMWVWEEGNLMRRRRLTGKRATWRLGCRPKCWIYKPGNREVCQYLLESRSDEQGLFPRDFGERRALPTAWCWKFSFRRCEWLSAVSSCSVCGGSTANGQVHEHTQSLCEVADANFFHFQNAWSFFNSERAVLQIEAEALEDGW